MLTIEELIHNDKKEPIKVVIDEDVRGKIITGMGAGREGSGCTRSLFQFAKRTAEHHKDKKVLLVDFHLTEPCLDRYFVESPKKLQMHLDTLYAQITRDIDKAQIRANTFNLREQSNLYLLPGTRRPFAADSFQADVLMAILQALRQLHDVVFVDVSAHVDNPATVAGVLAADHILAFSNYDEDGLRFFNMHYNTLFQHHPDVQSKLRMVGVESYLNRVEELKELTAVPVIGSLPHIPGFCVSSSITREPEGKKAISYLEGLDQILATLEIVNEEQVERKGGGFVWRMQQLMNLKG